MKKPVFNPEEIEIGEATYCPEDDKLRLYVGRVPRDQYEALRAQGWTSTPKQGCDFAAVWTPEREKTALMYGGGYIGDEDQDPADRAADRAERFQGYQQKRTGEALGLADSYDQGPTHHGYQNRDRAERQAARHDRQADRAVNQWEKAEYWQQRTAGVIAHALYKADPGVRMGRIKVMESTLRKNRASIDEHNAEYDAWQRINAIQDAEQQHRAGCAQAARSRSWTEYQHPEKPEITGTLYHLTTHHAAPITGGQAAALYLGKFKRIETNRWADHLAMRIAYENQMIGEQGGRLAHKDLEPGGKIGGLLILKVNKSTKTGRVVSVAALTHRVDGWAYNVRNIPGTQHAEMQIDTERMAPDMYQEPTDESRAELEAIRAEIKAVNQAKPAAPSLINPTDEDAQRLQDAINAEYLAAWIARNGQPTTYRKPDEPAQLLRMTQEQYSAISTGAYAKAETRTLHRAGQVAERHSNMWSSARQARDAKRGPAIAKIRVSGFEPLKVIVITDKPQKPLPAATWQPITEEAAA